MIYEKEAGPTTDDKSAQFSIYTAELMYTNKHLGSWVEEKTADKIGGT